MSQTERDIALLDAEWAARIDAHDIDAVIDLYDQNGSFLVPGRPPFEGHAAVRVAWEHLFGLPEFKLKLGLPAITAAASDDFAVDRGSYELSYRGDAGAVVERGKYLVVWRRDENSDWKIFADMFNNNG